MILAAFGRENFITHQGTQERFSSEAGFLLDEDPYHVSALESLLDCLQSKPRKKCHNGSQIAAKLYTTRCLTL